ncbi:hypothetical protein GCM10009069_01350 [Algimonas arctica]|uniref:Lipoprotein n=1 Tax=Algimonas arctica TaxID=1479486 RepID=A0A8J3CMM5_9PROT|nr:hypothetical protein [Algimonas arctica]GHA81990.1 hypothetical protein GCM10009069_01350 [Algimonas arctica]
MRQFVIIGLAAFSLSGCMTVAKTTGKAAALPFKATYFTGKTVGKGVVGTTKMVGKGAYATGKGVYYVGSVPVKITDQAMDTSTKILVMTTQVVDLSGKVFTVSSKFHASQLDSELMKFKRATNVLSVVIDAFA